MMPAKPIKPWLRKQNRTWYVKIEGKQVPLGKDKAEAHRRFHELMAGNASVVPTRSVRSDTVLALVSDFLKWTKANRAPRTYNWYRDFLDSFTLKFPGLLIGKITTHHVTMWINDRDDWGANSQRGAITALTRAFNWATKNRGLIRNPISGIEKPEAIARTETISPDEFEKILEFANDNFAELLIVSWDCGSRPQEVKAVEARHVDLAKHRWVHLTAEAKGKKKARAVYIPTERAMKIIRQRCKDFPDGAIFRNALGNTWTAYAVKSAFRRIETKIAKKYPELASKKFHQYMFRHTYITRKLVAGVDSHVVATLAGHSDTKMLDRTYSQVAQDHEFMLAQAKKDLK